MALFNTWPSLEQMKDVFSFVVNKGLSVLIDSNYYSLRCQYWDRGCARRLRVLLRCVSCVFTFLPYNEEREFVNLDSGVIEDLNINFNSFVLSSRGYLDDLAFIIEKYLPDCAKHKDPRCVAFEKIKWQEAGEKFEKTRDIVNEYLCNHKEIATIRNRSAHRLFPYLLSVFDSDEESLKYLEYDGLVYKSLSTYDFEGYKKYSKLRESMLHYHGYVMSDSLEKGEISFFVDSIHSFMLESLNDMLDLTVLVIKEISGRDYKSGSSMDPYLINYNWWEK